MKGDEATLAYLMGRAQAGDKPAYRALLSRCQTWLTAYFRRRLPPDDISDMVQEVLMALHAKRASWSPDRPFLPWLAAIARYRWVDHLRSHYRRMADQADMADADCSDAGAADAVLARVSLDRLMARLAPRQADALTLVKLDGLSVAEAAQRCGQSEASIKTNVHRAIRRLGALIEES